MPRDIITQITIDSQDKALADRLLQVIREHSGSVQDTAIVAESRRVPGQFGFRYATFIHHTDDV